MEGGASTTTQQLLLFGDLSFARFEDQLRQLLHIKGRPLVTAYFAQTGFQLRRLVSTLPVEQQELFPRFSSLVDLLAGYGTTEGTPVLKFFLLSVHQVAQALLYFEKTSRFPEGNSSSVIGPCTGGFAAAAVASSNNIHELARNGVAAALAAFRTALLSHLTGERTSVKTTDDSTESTWSAVCVAKEDLDWQALLDSYRQSRRAGPTSRLWISAVASGRSATVSGVPAILSDFVATNASTFKTKFLDIATPFHSSLLFSEEDAQEIVSSTFEGEFGPSSKNKVSLPFMSTSTGLVSDASTFGELLFAVVDDALRQPIHWDHLLQTIRDVAAPQQVEKLRLTTFTSNNASMVTSSLTKEAGVQIQVQTEDALEAGKLESDNGGESSGRYGDSKIAIIGYSGRFPTADSNEAFWELLKAGRDVHTEIPATRFDWKAHYDPTGKTKNTSRVKYGCFINEPGVFDARFFNMSPKEAENTDPAQRLAITTAYEAMEMAGLVPDRTASTQKDRIGVFFGTTSDDWREVNSGQDVGTYFIPGGNRAFVPGRISYFFGFSGPSLSIDTACSSSFAAIQSACGYLWRGECDTAVAGGTNVLTNPDNFAGLDRGHFLSTTGNCNAFDDGASGYCRSEAVGSVILKRLEDAEADCDPIFGVISGTNTNHCGQTDSITRPHEGDQASVFKRIVRHANVNPLDVSYVEMHGTGTQAGDATEMGSVLSVFTSGYKRTEGSKERSLYIGSAKANVGHAESASGVTSLIKVLMMMKNSEIPPHAGIKTKINHNYPLDLAQRGVHIAMKMTPWRREDTATGVRYSFLNNFSAAGGNTAIMLEDAPLPVVKDVPADGRSNHLVTVTAKSSDALLANLGSLASLLENRSRKIDLPSLSYTTTARRLHYKFRSAIVGSDLGALLANIRSTITNLQNTSGGIKAVATVKNKKPRVVFMYSGQGTLYASLAKTLYDTNPSFHKNLQRLSHLAQAQGFPSILKIINGEVSADSIHSEDAVVTQLALVCVQIALTDLWRSWGLEATAVIGHSLGEYPALYAAGVLTAADVIYLVGRRAQLLLQHCTPGTHAMLAVGGTLETVTNLLQEQDKKMGCEVACFNSPKAYVIAGPAENIADLSKTATASGIKNTLLNVPFAFHSAQIKPILGDYEQDAVRNVAFQPPKIPYLSPLIGRAVAVGDETTLNAAYLTQACRGRVDFAGALGSVLKDNTLGLGTPENIQWLEIGSHPVCGGMVKGTFETMSPQTYASLRQGVDAYKVITDTAKGLYLAGVDLDWNEYHRDFPAAHQVIDLPFYHWDLKNYWIQYRNNFTLYKGDLPAVQNVQPVKEIEAAPAKYISPCAQRVIAEEHGVEKSTLTTHSDIFDPRLLPILQGHLVNEAALCPSSMYADVATTMAEYLLSNKPDASSSSRAGLEVINVNIDKPLIAGHSETSHIFGVTATAHWSADIVKFSIFSVDKDGKQTTKHCSLDVRVVNNQTWLKTWARTSHLITSRVQALRNPAAAIVEQGIYSRFTKRMAYKLFSNLVAYSPEYQGMAEVVLNSSDLEAVAKVQFQVGKGEFKTDPRWIDSLGQVAGFIMNANDMFDHKEQVFINHGWDRIRIAEPFEAGKTYTAYNRMQLVEDTTYAGDTYILDGDRIVAIYEGVVFKGIPKRVLDHVLPRKSVPAAKPAAVQPKPVQTKAQPKSAPAPKAAKKSSQTAAPKAPKAANDPVAKLLSIIGSEIGVDTSSLGKGADFAELGVDSLLSLTILSRARDDLGLDLPASLFVDCETVDDLRRFMGGAAPEEAEAEGSEASSIAPSEQSSAVSTPATEYMHSPLGEGPTKEALTERLRVTALLMQIVAEETGNSDGSLDPSSNLADIGVDSLLGLTISSRLQEAFDVDINSSIFMDHETLHDVEKAICKAMNLSDSFGAETDNAPQASEESKPAEAPKKQAAEPKSNLPAATSVVLAGNLKKAKQVCFLFPDGSGSASSYIAFAQSLDVKDLAVCGLNCPWRKTATEMTRLGIDMKTMIGQYVSEVQRVLSQCSSKVSIVFGGWSAGGILALEAARQLREKTQLKLSQLILLDSPNPIGLQNPPKRMYDFFDSLGIFGQSGKVPEWLRAHFDAFIRVLDEYEPSALPDAPDTLMLYARDGVCKDPSGPQIERRADDPREMTWLLNNRTDFSASGWLTLLGKQNVRVSVMDDVNHFTLMDAGSEMNKMGKIVNDFLL